MKSQNVNKSIVRIGNSDSTNKIYSITKAIEKFSRSGGSRQFGFGIGYLGCPQKVISASNPKLGV